MKLDFKSSMDAQSNRSDQSPQRLAWSLDQIARFWDYRSAKDDQDSYFAKQVGRGVVQLASQVRDLAGLEVLDFGSGPGHLIPYLLERNARVSASDYSPKSIAEVDQRFSRHTNWGQTSVFDGKRLAWDDDSFDAVFCLETIEHLHDDDCRHIFDELLRVTRPGGFVMYTTPNEERLEEHYVYCPSCDCEFHRMQHLRSWSAEQLSSQLVSQGYEVPYCRGLDLWNFQPPTERQWRFSTLRSWLTNSVLSTLDKLFPRPFPQQRMLTRNVKPRRRRNLVAVASKPQPQLAVSARAA